MFSFRGIGLFGKTTNRSKTGMITKTKIGLMGLRRSVLSEIL